MHPTQAQLANNGFEGTYWLSSSNGSWATISVGAPVYWELNADPADSYEGSKSAKFVTTTSTFGPANLITNMFSVEAGKNYTISFWSKVKFAISGMRLRLDILPGQYVGSILSTPMDFVDITNSTFQKIEISFTATETKNIAVDFLASGSRYDNVLFVDNITITPSLTTSVSNASINKPDLIKSFVINNTASIYVLLENDYKGKVSFQIKEINGKTLLTENKTISSNTSIQQINIENLQRGIYFLTVIGKNGNKQTVKFFKN